MAAAARIADPATVTCCGLNATARRARLLLRTAPALILAAGVLATSASGAVTRGGKPDTPPGKAAAPAPVEAPTPEPAAAPEPVPAAVATDKKAKQAKAGAKQKAARSGKKPK